MRGATLWLWLVCCPLSAAQLEGINNAEVCGRCHRDILKAWKSSVHATAMENPVFQDALERAVETGGEDSRRVCLDCHTPTVRYSSDWRLRSKVSWEGVTCDFCHSLKSASFSDGKASLQVRFDGIKTGPLRDAASIAHGTAFSEVHTTSVMCAGCHEYRNRQGFPVLTTYSEWQQSSYGSDGRNCQQCHMAETAAQVVDPKVQRLARTTVNLHQMPGSHSIKMLNEAVQLRMKTERQADELVVTINLQNRGAGHMVPTGSALRRLGLDVEVNVAGRSQVQSRNYQRRVADKAGREIQREELLFLYAAQELSDSRLKPGETREEVFRFAVPFSSSARVNSRLSYAYSSQENSTGREPVNFLSLPQHVPPGR